MTKLSEFYPYFVSLGDNCEFGFAQRHHQVETGGLLRWSIVPPDALIRCLRNRFSGLYEFDNLVPFAVDMVLDQATGLAFHSEIRSKQSGGNLIFVDPLQRRREIYSEEFDKIRYLTRKLLGQLDAGKFVFVYKNNSGVGLTLCADMANALSSYNQKNILLIVESDPTRPPSLSRLSKSLYLGTIEKFAPYTTADDIKQESWDFLVRQLSKVCILDDARDFGERERVTLIARQASGWSEGIAHELWFWSRWFETRGLDWPDDFAARLDSSQQLIPALQNLLPASPTGAVRILDVGAGPMTNIGFAHESLPLDIIACDPLADFYSTLSDRHGIQRPIVTHFAVAEDLSSYIAEDSFDIVHCCNALDHSADPVRGLIEMLRVLKKNGAVYLKHHINEAQTENYQGFHQFNFDVRDGRFVIWNKVEFTDVLSVLPIRVDISISLEDPDVVVIIKKLEDFDNSHRTMQVESRLKDFQRAFILRQTQQASEGLGLN
jgi:SAM-dependent methyltransferase